MSSVMKVVKYTTPDGSSFNTYEEAVAHINEHSLREELRRWCDNALETQSAEYYQDHLDEVNDLVDLIVAHGEGLLPILKRHFDGVKAPVVVPEERLPFVELPVSSLAWNMRLSTLFKDVGIQRIGDIVSRTADEWMAVSGVGQATISDIEKRLRDFGLALGMFIPGWNQSQAPLERTSDEPVAEQEADSDAE